MTLRRLAAIALYGLLAGAWALLAGGSWAVVAALQAELQEARQEAQEARWRAWTAARGRYPAFYEARWVGQTCSRTVGWIQKPLVRDLLCAPGVQVYRAGELEAVRARAQAAGAGAGLVVVEQRGPEERALKVTWTAEIRR